MKVLILTGGVVSGIETSVVIALRRLFVRWRASEHAWLDVKIKLVFAEFLVRGPRQSREDLWAPDLTEVLLATLLRQECVPYALATFGDLFDRSRLVEQHLETADCVFLSTTFLRDLSELMPLVRRLKRPQNRVVVGGPLASLLAERWEGDADVGIPAAGYGEFLVLALAAWIRSGFAALTPPAGGKLVTRGPTKIDVFGHSPPIQACAKLSATDQQNDEERNSDWPLRIRENSIWERGVRASIFSAEGILSHLGRRIRGQQRRLLAVLSQQ